MALQCFLSTAEGSEYIVRTNHIFTLSSSVSFSTLSTLVMMRSTIKYGSWMGNKRGLRVPSGDGRKERLLKGIGSIAPSAKRLST